jgi:hypothetical protein
VELVQEQALALGLMEQEAEPELEEPVLAPELVVLELELVVLEPELAVELELVPVAETDNPKRALYCFSKRLVRTCS